MAVRADGFSSHSFRGGSGCIEHCITVEALGEQSLARQIDSIEQRYAEALQSLGLTPDTAIFRRIYLSDAANQAGLLRESALFTEPTHSPVAVAMIQQPPLPDAKLALFAYHLQSPDPTIKKQLSPEHMLVERNGLGHLWSTRLCAANATAQSSTTIQTNQMFDRLIDTLHAGGGTLADNCVRTWIYVKDVDYFYQEMVSARTALFDRHGLTADTHYLASTGIEGSCSHRYDTVLMDAYSILGLRPEQTTYLNDFDRLCPTRDYNVTFERGTRIGYADRAHHFISGTASIDTTGSVVHPGDVTAQLSRTLDNIDALLRSGEAGIDDMTHFLVYLRDPSDFPAIDARLAERFPHIPRLILRGAVCRPEWLIEIEGIAISPQHQPELPNF